MKTVITKLYPNEPAITDAKVTYCCSATPCYFVEYPDGYSGYFEVKDCTFIKE